MKKNRFFGKLNSIRTFCIFSVVPITHRLNYTYKGKKHSKLSTSVENDFRHLDDKGHCTEDPALYRDPLTTSGARLWGMGTTGGCSLHRNSIPVLVIPSPSSCTCPTKCLQPDPWLRSIHDYLSFSKTNSFATLVFLLHDWMWEWSLGGRGAVHGSVVSRQVDCQKAGFKTKEPPP